MPEGSDLSMRSTITRWVTRCAGESYINVYDLADAIVLAAESDLPGHEAFYIASPDNVGNRPFEETVREYYGDKVEVKMPLSRKDASGISIAKAERMLGYAPKRSGSD